MKNFRNFIALIIVLNLISCSKDELTVVNPNNPTFEALNSETGVRQLASGVYANSITVGDNWYNFYWVTMANHENMADVTYTPWGNWSWRWANQPTSITLDDGTVVTPPQEGAQGVALETRNVRTQGESNAFAHEWMTMYKTNNTANLILDLIDQTNFPQDAVNKKAVFKAWAYFWKGYAYSRIGSMYTAGLILTEPNTTNNNFVSNTLILGEAKANFEKAIQELNSTTGDISTITSSIIPSHLTPSAFRGNTFSSTLNKDMWIRNINTFMARNILVNKKVVDMTPADWTEITNLTNNGLRASDFVFVMKQDGNNFITTTTVPFRLTVGWHFLSERLVQDFKPGDRRFTDNVRLLGTPQVNRSGRGIQYGTRYEFIPGRDYATQTDRMANIYYGATYAENELMKAEALIYSNQIDNGLTIIDNIRNHQLASLPAVSGTSLTRTQALEELRKERRIGLLLRGVGFYDARRWNVTKQPKSGLTVLDALGNVNTNATFNYNYLDYWSVPDQELAFNVPSDESAEVISVK